MKTLFTLSLTLVICITMNAQKISILKSTSIDTLRFEVVNKEFYKFIIVVDNKTKYERSFIGKKYYEIKASNYIYTKKLDTKNRILGLFFDRYTNLVKDRDFKLTTTDL